MNYPSQLFPFPVLITTTLLAVALLGLCIYKVRWRLLDHQALNAWMGASVLVMVLWLLKGGLKPGLTFHLLGAGILTLMMGPWLALIALLLVILAVSFTGLGDFFSVGLNWLVMGAMPVGFVSLALMLARRWLSANIFIYIFVNAFITGGASYFASGLTGIGVLALAGAYPTDYLYGEALPVYFLLSWSEAFLTGLVIAILVVYRPKWVSTFDDARYLNH
jgi:uncharacterized membrane protein